MLLDNFRRFSQAGLLASIVGLLAAPGIATAQAWPTRPIKVVVHFPPGGIADLGARALTDGMAPILGQPFIIENKPGGGGRTGAEQVVRSKPDGYTLLFATNSPLSFAPITNPEMTYDPVKDLAPVVPVAAYSLQVVVNNDLPVRTLRELIDYAKKNPGKLNYATPGQGSAIHFAIELFKSMAGIDMTHVPYRGSAQLMTDLVSGQVHVTFDGAARTYIDAGKLRLLAVTDTKRDPRFSNAPTVDEAGVKGYKFIASQLLLAPAGTPPEIIAKINAAANKVLADKKVQASLAEAGLYTTGGSGEQITKLIIDGIAENRRVATQAKLVFE